MARGKYEYWLTKEGLTLLEGWARDGLVDAQLAHNIGISTCTLYEWKRRFPKIGEALKKGKEIVDIEVENALLKRALGYSYTETMTEESDDGTKYRETTKFVPPDTTAQIFWLRNRKPEKWRNNPEGVVVEEQSTGVIVLAAAELMPEATPDIDETEQKRK